MRELRVIILIISTTTSSKMSTLNPIDPGYTATQRKSESRAITPATGRERTPALSGSVRAAAAGLEDMIAGTTK